MAERLGLGPTEEWALDRAGRHHDQGKADPRFQVLLRGEGDGSSDGPRPLLAKSGLRSPAQTRAARAAAGLPLGWRHEQLSAAYTAARLGITSAESMLAVRLVGTSHGHGRVAFPHASAGLFGDQASDLDELSRDLFDAGAWDEVVMRTHRAHGVWGCAYLEAILRAADSQISRQGG
jgi:CRISPR-associated endonuclease/helicase Cas3